MSTLAANSFDNMIPYFGYIRVSTPKQGKGVSLDEQRSAIELHAQRNNLQVVEWFEEKETAAKRGRPLFSEVLKRLRKGEAAGLIVHKIDRSARNLRDWADLGELIDSGIQVHFANESLDLSSRGGRLSADIQAVVAADYIRNLREETKKGHRGRLKQGLYPFPAPLGYRNEGPGKLKSIDPVQGPLIREAFERYGTGECSLGDLAEEMHERGLRTGGGKRVHKSLLAEILHNPFYCGRILIKRTGETYLGKHEKLVSPSLCGHVQDLLSGKSVRGRSSHSYPFRGLFGCKHCDRSLVPERQKGHVYYRCHAKDCPSKTVREELVEEKIKECLGELRFTEPEKDQLRELLQEIKVNGERETLHTRASLERDLGNVETRLVRLTTAYLDADVDKETYQATKSKLLEEKQRIAEALDELSTKPGSVVTRAEKALELAFDALLTYESGSPAEKRELLRMLCSNRTLEGKELSVELQFPFTEAANSACMGYGCPTQDGIRTPEQLGHILQAFLGWARKG